MSSLDKLLERDEYACLRHLYEKPLPVREPEPKLDLEQKYGKVLEELEYTQRMLKEAGFDIKTIDERERDAEECDPDEFIKEWLEKENNSKGEDTEYKPQYVDIPW